MVRRPSRSCTVRSRTRRAGTASSSACRRRECGRRVREPLRGLTSDSAYVADLLEQTPGPVVAVGHSYGGAVITNAAARANVKALVFVAAFAPDEGERLADVEAGSKDSVLNSALVPLRHENGEGRLSSSRSIRRSSRSRPTCPRTRRRCWPRRNVRWPSRRSRTARARPLGKTCRPGRSSRRRTRRRAPTSCVRWRSAPARRRRSRRLARDHDLSAAGRWPT